MIIDAKNVILGRLASVAAKKALMGEEIIIVNSEKAIITGSKKDVLKKYRERVARGTPRKGPFWPRQPEMFVKRTIRGMLPYKQEKGLNALKRIRCYTGLPEEYQGKETASLQKHDVSKLSTLEYGTIETICKELGGNL